MSLNTCPWLRVFYTSMQLVRHILTLGLLCVAAQLTAMEVTTPELRGAMQPQLTADDAGRVYLAFGRAGAVYVAVSTKAGESFAPAVRLGELPKLALGMRRGPRIVASSQGVVVSAISHQNGNLHLWRSTDRGEHWTSLPPLNSVTNSAREGMHTLTGNKAGKVFAAWLDLRNGKTEIWGASSDDAGQTWSSNERIYASPDGHTCECCAPAASMSPDGAVAVTWRNWLGGARDIFAATSADGGRTFGPARKLGIGTWVLPGCPMDGGDVALLEGNRLSAVWRRQESIFLTTPGAPEQLLAARGRQPVLCPTDEGWDVFWQRGNELWRQRVPAGQPELHTRDGAYPVLLRVAPGKTLLAYESAGKSDKAIYCEVLR